MAQKLVVDILYALWRILKSLSAHLWMANTLDHLKFVSASYAQCEIWARNHINITTEGRLTRLEGVVGNEARCRSDPHRAILTAESAIQHYDGLSLLLHLHLRNTPTWGLLHSKPASNLLKFICQWASSWIPSENHSKEIEVNGDLRSARRSIGARDWRWKQICA